MWPGSSFHTYPKQETNQLSQKSECIDKSNKRTDVTPKLKVFVETSNLFLNMTHIYINLVNTETKQTWLICAELCVLVMMSCTDWSDLLPSD